MVRTQVLRLVSLPLWCSLSKGRLQLELHEHPQLTRHWKHLNKKETKAAQQEGYVPILERSEGGFIPSLLSDFLATLQAAVSESGEANPVAVSYCERFVDFVSELLSQLPTRRFLHALVDDKALLVKCQMSALYTHPAGQLFVKLVDTMRFYLAFPIDDHSGDAQTDDDVTAQHYEKVQQLQRLFFKHWESLKDLALSNCGTVQQREVLQKELGKLSPADLKLLVTRQLRLVGEEDPLSDNSQFLMAVMMSAYEKRQSQRQLISGMPLYPTEELLLDEGQVPVNEYRGDAVLSLPKLNLQFLTLPDYLLRNFYLYRLEAAYEVREDIADVLKRMSPYLGEDDATHFGGWSRMATTIDKFAVIEVRKPKVGENRPGAVTADIVVQTKHMRQEVKEEWDGLKQHDVLFLLGVMPSDDINRTQARFQSKWFFSI